MKINLIVFLFMASLLTANAQTIPAITGETIDNKIIHFPSDIKGKYSLLCFASSQKAQKDLEGWLDPVYQKFIAKTGIMDDMFDVNVYFIPLITGSNQAFASSIKKKFRESAQSDLKPHVLFLQGDVDNVMSALQLVKSDTPEFFLLDKENKIIYKTRGTFTEEKFDRIDELISE